MRLLTELVSIPTDTKPLDGAYYEPEGGATAGGALLFHGNTMNFYTGAMRFLPPVLTRMAGCGARSSSSLVTTTTCRRP